MHYIVDVGDFQKTEPTYRKAQELAIRVLENPEEFLNNKSDLQGRTSPDELISYRYESLDEMYADLNSDLD